MSKAVILCVDDEVFILESLKRQLYKAFQNDYIYESAENAIEALETIEEIHKKNLEIAVIISDWLMPGLRGDEFLIEVHKKFPHIIKIILTGQADEKAIERVKQQANLHSCLQKPWKSEELIKTIKSGLEKL
jgi:CheY-like chemotaxis protein